MGQVHQKRYNLMIVGKEIIEKLDSLPERHKGMYVSEAIAGRLRKEREDLCTAHPLKFIPCSEKGESISFEEYLRDIIKDEIGKNK